jgi:hypothetical protein
MRYIQASTPIAGRGLSSRSTPNGTILTLASDPAHPSFPRVLPQCWEIACESAEVNGAQPARYHKLINRYYRLGGRIFECPDETTLESLISEEKVFVAFEIGVEASGEGSYARVVGFKSWGEMEEACRDRLKTVIPLYEFEPPKDDEKTDVIVKCDLRTMLLAQEFEWGIK